MQVQSIMSDLIEFKDEIFKKVRLLEKQLISEVNTKYTEMHTNYEKLENRITFISENNESILEMVSSQRVNMDKIKELESFKNKTEHNLMNQDIKIKSISTDIDKIKLKYDKALQDNFEVVGIVGPGCQFKSIAEYIINNVAEFSQLKYDRDQMKIESVEIKNRLDNILKSTMNLVDNSIVRCQKYTDNKHKDMQNILNNKLLEIAEKNMDIRTHISKIDIKNENQIEILKGDIEKLSIVKSELITLTDRKIEEINKKIEALTYEINLIKSKKKEKIKDKEKDNNSSNNNNIENSNSKNNKNKEEINISNINVNNIKKTHYKLQKNPIVKYSDKNLNIIDSLSNHINNDIEQQKINKINYNQEDKKQIQNKEEQNFNSYEKENSSINNKIIQINNKNIKEYQPKIKEEIKYKNKINEESNINNIEKYYQNSNYNNNNSVLDEDKIMKDILTFNIKKTQIETIKEDKNLNFLNIQNYKNQDLQNSTHFYKNKNSTKKIKIESIEKKKYIHSTNSIENDIRNKKEEYKEEKEYDEYKLKPLLHKTNDNQKITKTSSSLNKNYIKINTNIIKTINKNNNNNFIIESKAYNTIDKSTRRKNIEFNKEQTQIMNQIKTYYNNKKELNEQKSQENIVDCNIINLNFEKALKNKDKNNSAKNTIYITKDIKSSKVNSLRNNLSEIGMKIAPVFGRTTYRFYNKKENIGIGMQSNRKQKSLKESLNMALVTSIKQKINLKDKAINVK